MALVFYECSARSGRAAGSAEKKPGKQGRWWGAGEGQRLTLSLLYWRTGGGGFTDNPKRDSSGVAVAGDSNAAPT